MKSTRWFNLALVLGIGLMGALGGPSARAGEFVILDRDVEPNGVGQLVADSSGNLLATTYMSVEKFFADTNYTTYKIIYTLPAESYSPLTLTSQNVILGMTFIGGDYNDGALFNLGKSVSPSYSALHSFSGTSNPAQPNDGVYPEGGLTPGLFNRYYGTSVSGGRHNQGIVFQTGASPADSHYKILYRFNAKGDGYAPTEAGLVANVQGALFGVTTNGGAYGTGAVYTLEYDNGWHEQVIHSFGGPGNFKGVLEDGNVALDAAGNLYGCAAGGPLFNGGVYELTPPLSPGGAWTETVLYEFDDDKGDGSAGSYGGEGECSVTVDKSSGRIVGVNDLGGKYNGGTLFALVPPSGSNKAWSDVIWHNFGQNPKDKGADSAPLLYKGVYYGGGSYLYAYTPSP